MVKVGWDEDRETTGEMRGWGYTWSYPMLPCRDHRWGFSLVAPSVRGR